MFKKIKKELGITCGLADFLAQQDNLGRARYDPTPSDIVAWAEKVRWLKGEKFSFVDREYLKPIYRDVNKEIRIVKPRQAEFTEFAVNWLLFNCTKNPGTVGLYLSDRQDHVSFFSRTRLKSQGINQSSILKPLALKGNVSWQPFKNDSNIMMYTAWGEFEAARSIPVDFAVADEMQSLQLKGLPKLKETLSKSKFGRLLEIGTGSDEGSAWHKEWSGGTIHGWNFEKKIYEQKSETVPGISSYQITTDMLPWLTTEILEYKRCTYNNQRLFVTDALGMWYKSARKPLTKEEIEALFDNTLEFTDDELVDHSMPVFMGVDWGGGTQAFTVPWIWQLIDEKAPRFKLLYTTRLEERSTEKQADMIALLMDKFGVDQMVMDSGGGKRQVEKLSDRYGERAYTCSYTYDASDLYKEVPHSTKLNVDRTWAIDNIIDLITRPEKRTDYPKPIPRLIIPSAELYKVEWLIDEFTCIEAETKETFGKSFVVYKHPEEKTDDGLHACVYAYLAWLKHKSTRWIGGSL